MKYQITAPHFTAGIIIRHVNDDIAVIAAAPIVKYMMGWTLHRVRLYCVKNNWKLKEIEL